MRRTYHLSALLRFGEKPIRREDPVLR